MLIKIQGQGCAKISTLQKYCRNMIKFKYLQQNYCTFMLCYMMANHHSHGARQGETDQMAPPQYLKVFIQRDYSEGTLVRFQTRFPQELEGRVSLRFERFLLYQTHFIISVRKTSIRNNNQQIECLFSRSRKSNMFFIL